MDAWDAEQVDRVFQGLLIHEDRIKRMLKQAEQKGPKRHGHPPAI